MIGATIAASGAEFTIIDMTATPNPASTNSQSIASCVYVGSASGSWTGSAFDASPFMGWGWVEVYMGSQASVISTAPVLQYMDTSVYWSILSVAQADASGTWANFTTSPFATISTANVGFTWRVPIDWDAVEGKYVRLYLVNNSLNACRTATGIAIGRKEKAGS